MKRFVLIISVAVLGFAGLNAVIPSPIAAQTVNTEALQTQTFTVDKMTCAACPITVKTAMSRVDGVRSVTVNFEARTATVTFNATVTTAAEIAEASKNAGYPARTVEG
ncbi:MAG: cation transporter [Hyphomonas sp.]|nr:cation transporter [Hyphomonas sp.]